MKPLLITLFIPLLSISQPKIGAGLAEGYSSRHAPIAEMYLAAKLSNHFSLHPIAIKVHASKSDPTLPTIFETRAAYKIKSFEFYSGIAYHKAGMDGRKEYKQYKGFKFAAGIIKHIGPRFIITTGISGNVYTLAGGVFSFK